MTKSPAITRRAASAAEKISRSVSLVKAIAEAAEYAVGFNTVDETCESAERVLARFARMLKAEKAAVKAAPSKADVDAARRIVEKMENGAAEIVAVVHGVRAGAWPNISAAESWRDVREACLRVLALVPAYAATLSGTPPEDTTRH